MESENTYWFSSYSHSFQDLIEFGTPCTIEKVIFLSWGFKFTEKCFYLVFFN